MHASYFVANREEESWPFPPVLVDQEKMSSNDDSRSDRLFRRESLARPPEHRPEPYSLQWFLAIEHERHHRQARWIPHLLEFARHQGETLLGLGNGLGTDWLQYAKHGAKVIACSPVAQQLTLIRKNFELRGLAGRFLHAAPTALPLADASIDVVCLSGVLHETPQPGLVLQEVFRVLKPGGKVLAFVPSRYNLAYWKRVFFPWKRKGRLLGFSRRGLKRLCQPFVEYRIHKRHVNRKELPWLLRWLPTYGLHRLVGQYLILKAFKPITFAAAAARVAA